MKHRIYAIPGTMCDERLWEKLGSIGSEDFEVIHTPIPAEESLLADGKLGKLSTHCQSLTSIIFPYLEQADSCLYSYSIPLGSALA